MSKWKHREENKKISRSVVAHKSTSDLKKAKRFLTGLLDLRKTEKLEKTYIKGTRKALDYNENGKIYVDFKFDGTATGRLSCASYHAQKAMGVLFHTLPREEAHNIRSAFSAPPNMRFIAADYAAMELRVLAHVANEGSMQIAFNEGHDLHTYTARLLFNKQNISKQERQIAKTVSFLIVYGGGAFNLSETMSIPLKRAEKIIENYSRVYPGIFSYMEVVNNFIVENGYALTIFGRKRNLPDVYSKDRTVVNRALRQGLNFTIQSSASDILLCAVLGMSKQFKDEGLNARVLATVHDSVEVVSSPEDEQRTLEVVKYHMVENPTLRNTFNIDFHVPFDVDLEVGTSFGNVKEVEV